MGMNHWLQIKGLFKEVIYMLHFAGLFLITLITYMTSYQLPGSSCSSHPLASQAHFLPRLLASTWGPYTQRHLRA